MNTNENDSINASTKVPLPVVIENLFLNAIDKIKQITSNNPHRVPVK